MAYQVLARKWRPQDFENVVGQGAVVQALRNALSDGRIAHSYLFSGIRGVGKTTVARVLAKALNCQTGPPSDPCNDCDICRDITAGSDLDVLEIDAATYSKVEQVRELTESLRYGPARNKYKVVIIDEIHRLSRQAFDALLKIVEEPPGHLVFIFATTESEAVPATILSRCQAYQFRRVPLTEMVAHLTNVSSSEGFEVSEHGLNLIARASEGSVRDAISLLDQLATFGGGKILDEEVGRILGGVDLALFLDLIRAIVAGDRAHVAGFVDTVEELGWDPRHVYGEFLSYCRDALHLSLDSDNARVDLPEEEARSLAATASETGYENLLRLLNLLLESEMTVRRSESAGLALEIALLRAAELPKLTAIEELLSSGGGAGAGGGDAGRKPARKSAAKSGKAPAPATKTSASKASAPKVATKEVATKEVAAPEVAAAEPPESPKPVEMSGPTDEPEPDIPPRPPDPPEPPEGPEAPEVPEPPEGPEPPKEPEPLEAPGPSDSPDSLELTGSPDVPASPVASEAEPSLQVTKAAPSAPPTPARAAAMAEAPANGDKKPKAAPEPPPILEGREVVLQLLERLSYLKQSLAAHLSDAQSLAVREGVLIVSIAPDDSFLERSLQRPANRELLDNTLTEMLGPAATWRVRVGEAVVEEGESEASSESTVTDDPTVQTVLDLFGGRIEAIERHPEAGDNRGASE